MGKITDSDNFTGDFGDLLEEGVAELLSQPIEVECPDCGAAFEAVPLVTDRCPRCGSPVRWE